MAHISSLPYVAEVVALLVDSRFTDSIKVINTASNIYDLILVPYSLASDSPIFDYYPPLRELVQTRPLTLTPEVQAYIEQIPDLFNASIFAENFARDKLYPARLRLIYAYQRALIRRADQMTQNETRIDAPFPPMTTEEYQERVAFVVERARAIPIEQTVDWWADVTCGVALTSPSEAALAALAATHPESQSMYHRINSWRQIGYIVEGLER